MESRLKITAEDKPKNGLACGQSTAPCSTAKPLAPCTKHRFMESVWELYREWCEHENVVKLPDFEEAFHFVAEHGFPD